MVFPVVMYGCESWTTKKAEPQRMEFSAYYAEVEVSSEAASITTNEEVIA